MPVDGVATISPEFIRAGRRQAAAPADPREMGQAGGLCRLRPPARGAAPEETASCRRPRLSDSGLFCSCRQGPDGLLRRAFIMSFRAGYENVKENLLFHKFPSFNISC